jgi:hypothetical protein
VLSKNHIFLIMILSIGFALSLSMLQPVSAQYEGERQSASARPYAENAPVAGPYAENPSVYYYAPSATPYTEHAATVPISASTAPVSSSYGENAPAKSPDFPAFSTFVALSSVSVYLYYLKSRRRI